MVRYRTRRPADFILRQHIKELALARRRFGYRRLHFLLDREGIHMNHKRFRRLYREEKLQVKRRRGRKRALGTRAPMQLPAGPNERWSMDFVSDSFTDGRRFRIFAVVDDFSRECLALVPDTSISGTRVARELDQLIKRRGQPMRCVSRQRYGVHQHGDPQMEPGSARRLALHRTGQAAAECIHRIVQRPTEG